MAQLILSGATLPMIFADRFLAHFQLVFVAKQRRREGTLLTWGDDANEGSNRHVLWMPSPTVAEFVFKGIKPLLINRQWLDHILEQANSTSGVVMGEEPEVSTQ